ncbi:MAG: hypothetical protein C5B52_11510 [Bacteroidetes bacterium]|nr:MAG: hypothetical protein C5B52_11510 [Bacteroidota bacterium]
MVHATKVAILNSSLTLRPLLLKKCQFEGLFNIVDQQYVDLLHVFSGTIFEPETAADFTDLTLRFKP